MLIAYTVCNYLRGRRSWRIYLFYIYIYIIYYFKTSPERMMDFKWERLTANRYDSETVGRVVVLCIVEYPVKWWTQRMRSRLYVGRLTLAAERIGGPTTRERRTSRNAWPVKWEGWACGIGLLDKHMTLALVGGGWLRRTVGKWTLAVLKSLYKGMKLIVMIALMIRLVLKVNDAIKYVKWRLN